MQGVFLGKIQGNTAVAGWEMCLSLCPCACLPSFVPVCVGVWCAHCAVLVGWGGLAQGKGSPVSPAHQNRSCLGPGGGGGGVEPQELAFSSGAEPLTRRAPSACAPGLRFASCGKQKFLIFVKPSLVSIFSWAVTALGVLRNLCLPQGCRDNCPVTSKRLSSCFHI